VVVPERRAGAWGYGSSITGDGQVIHTDRRASRTDDPGPVIGRHAVPDVHDRRAGTSREAGIRVARRDTVADRSRGRTIPLKAENVEFQPDVVERSFHDGAHGGIDENASTRTLAVVADDRILDENLGGGARSGRRDLDARTVRATEVVDCALLDVERAKAAEHLDTVQAGPEPFDVEAAQHHVAGRRRVDDDGVRAGHQHAGLKAFAGDGDRLGNRHSAEATGIEDVDLAAGGGLRDGARERLAGGRAAARVGVVADTGDPGPGRLRVSERAEGEQQYENGYEAERRPLPIHGNLL